MNAQVYHFPTGGRPRLGGKEYGEPLHFLVPPQMHKEMRQLSEETGEPIAHHLREAWQLYQQMRPTLLSLAKETGETPLQLALEAADLLSMMHRGEVQGVPLEESPEALPKDELLKVEANAEEATTDQKLPQVPEAPKVAPKGEAALLWERLWPRLKERVGQNNFDTWLSCCSPKEGDAQELLLLVPNEFFREYLTEHYTGVIQEELSALGEARTLRFEIAPPAELPPSLPKAKEALPEEEAPPVSTKTEEPPSPETVEEQLQEIDRQEKQILEDIRAAKSCPYYVMAANFFLLSKTLLDELYRQRARLLGELPKTHRLGLLKSLHEYREAKREMERRAKEGRRPGKKGAG